MYAINNVDSHDMAKLQLLVSRQPASQLIYYAKRPRDCGGIANEFDRDLRRVSIISNEPTNELDRERSYLRPLVPLACGVASLISKK